MQNQHYAQEAGATAPENNPMDTPMVSAALNLAAAGWEVFPLVENTKRPLTTHGVKDATTDADTIRAWWERNPEANLGLAPGADVLVLDVDTKHGSDGHDTLTGLEFVHGELPPTRTTETPSGGWHLYFKKPPELRVKNRVNVRPGLDVRTLGGYLVAPPSVIDGKPYRWLNDAPMADAPPWLVALVTEEKQPAPPMAPQAPTAAPRGEHDRYTQRAIERATNAVFSANPGQRNDTLNATTYGLARLAAAGRLDWGQESEKLERAADAAGLAPAEIRATLKSAWDAGSTKPNFEGMPRDNGQTLQQLDIDADTGELREPAPHPLALIVAPCEQLQAPRWLLPGFMAEGLTLIAGGHGAGKTTALLPLACGVAGIHEPGWPLAPKHWREVVYIIEDIDQAQRVLHGLACHLGTTAQAIAERVHLVDARRLPADYLVKVGATYRERYTRTVEGVELLPLVLLDTQAATIALENENDNSEASAAVAMLKQHFEGLPVWLVAHVAKANINRTEAMAARGASAWEADANATAFLIKEGEERWLMLGKRRFEPRWPEMQLQSYFKEEVGYDAWGEFETVPLRWAIARPAEGTRAAQQAEAKAAQAAGEEAALRQEIRDTVQSAWQEGNPLNRAGVKGKIRRKTAEVVACIECLLSEGWLLEIHVPREQRTHPRRSDFLINLTSAEREDIRAGLPAPERKTTIPESWKKPFSSVPDTEAEKAPKGGEVAA